MKSPFGCLAWQLKSLLEMPRLFQAIEQKGGRDYFKELREQQKAKEEEREKEKREAAAARKACLEFSKLMIMWMHNEATGVVVLDRLELSRWTTINFHGLK